jgi:HSP20 family protein
MRALAPWRPFRELSTLRHDIDDLFGRFFGEEEGWMRPFDSGFSPAVESFQRGDELVVRAELAVEADCLTIKGERRLVDEGRRSGGSYREVSYGCFERTLQLPAGVDAESIKAAYHDGVLEVTMKAPKGLVSKKVPVSVH